MKTKLPEEIKTDKQAKDFLLELISNDEVYHPEDDAGDIINFKTKENLFTEKEALLLNRLMGQIYALNSFDPCGFIIDVTKMGESARTNSIQELMIEDVKNIHQAFKKLNANWDKFTDEYDEHLVLNFPFEQSFDELTLRVSEWAKPFEEMNINNNSDYNHIEKIETINTGGNCMVDYFKLSDGTMIGITDEVIVLYNVDNSDLIEDETSEIACVGIIDFGIEIDDYWKLKENTFEPHWFLKVHNESDDGIVKYDIIEMKNGISITIDDGMINVYPSLEYAKKNLNLINSINR